MTRESGTVATKRLAIIVALGVLLTSCNNAQTTYSLEGTFVLTDERSVSAAFSFCSGRGGYSDISAGSQVTVTDQAGKVIGVGRLDEGKIDPPASCRFTFKVLNLPKAEFYAVEVGRRGRLVRSFAEMEASGWKIGLSLGRS